MSAAALLRCNMSAFVSRFGANNWVRFSQFRVHRSRASLADPA